MKIVKTGLKPLNSRSEWWWYDQNWWHRNFAGAFRFRNCDKIDQKSTPPQVHLYWFYGKPGKPCWILPIKGHSFSVMSWQMDEHPSAHPYGGDVSRENSGKVKKDSGEGIKGLVSTALCLERPCFVSSWWRYGFEMGTIQRVPTVAIQVVKLYTKHIKSYHPKIWLFVVKGSYQARKVCRGNFFCSQKISDFFPVRFDYCKRPCGTWPRQADLLEPKALSKYGLDFKEAVGHTGPLKRATDLDSFRAANTRMVFLKVLMCYNLHFFFKHRKSLHSLDPSQQNGGHVPSWFFGGWLHHEGSGALDCSFTWLNPIDTSGVLRCLKKELAAADARWHRARPCESPW